MLCEWVRERDDRYNNVSATAQMASQMGFDLLFVAFKEQFVLLLSGAVTVLLKCGLIYCFTMSDIDSEHSYYNKTNKSLFYILLFRLCFL